MNFNDSNAAAVAAIGAVTTTLIQPYDVIDVTVDILRSAVHAAGANAGGLILRRLGQDRLQLLAATSHRAEELELYQAQHQEGPCFQAVETGEPVTATTPEHIRVRWPQVAGAFRTAGVTAVHAVPLCWQRDVIGALNLFFTVDRPAMTPGVDLQVFADLATLAIVHNTPVTATQILARTRTALDERKIIERAKGVLAQQHHLDMAAAYQLLLDTARERDQRLSITAAAVVEAAVQRR